MGTKAIVTVALMAVVAVGVVDTLSLAEAGGRGRGRNPAHVEASNVPPSVGGAQIGPVVSAKDDKPKDQKKALQGLEAQDKMGNFEIQGLMSDYTEK